MKTPTTRHFLIAIAVGALVLAGCSKSDDTPTRSAAELQLITEVQSLSFKSMINAIDLLASSAYKESVSIVEVSPEDRSLELGSRSYVKIAEAGELPVIDSSTVALKGSSESVVEPLGKDEIGSSVPQLPFALPPTFVSDRHIHKFDYASKDSVVGDKAFKLYRIVKRGGAQDALTETSLLVESESNEVVEILDRSHNRAFMFAADNTVHLRLIRNGNDWLPADYEYDLRIKAPMRTARRFLVVKQYSYDAPLARSGIQSD